MNARLPIGHAFIDGIALWSPRLPGWPLAARILRGELSPPSEPARRPSSTLLPPTERRRAPDTVAVALEVAAAACDSAAVAAAQTPSVFASTHGDLAISDYMCETLASTPSLTSPTKFHNSVHNAAAGYWTIATGCYKPYTALTAFTHTFGQALLEGLVQCSTGHTPVLVVAYDIEARGPMAAMAPSQGLFGAGLVLAPIESAATKAAVTWRVVADSAAKASSPKPASQELVGPNAMSPCLPMFEALASSGGTAAFSLGPQMLLQVDVTMTEH